MKNDFVNLELIQNHETVRAMFTKIRSLGQVLICDGCGDADAVIVGFLVSRSN